VSTPKPDGDAGLDITAAREPLEARGEPEGRKVPTDDVRRYAQNVEGQEVDAAGEQTLEGSQPAACPVEQDARRRRRRDRKNRGDPRRVPTAQEESRPGQRSEFSLICSLRDPPEPEE
jgi:hypothetical protein